MILPQFRKANLNSSLNDLVPASDTAVINQTIQVKPFLDIDLDISGWYAPGHHSAEDFLAAVIERDDVHSFHFQNVKQGWAKFEGNRFEFVTRPLTGFQPITVLESLI